MVELGDGLDACVEVVVTGLAALLTIKHASLCLTLGLGVQSQGPRGRALLIGTMDNGGRENVCIIGGLFALLVLPEAFRVGEASCRVGAA